MFGFPIGIDKWNNIKCILNCNLGKCRRRSFGRFEGVRFSRIYMPKPNIISFSTVPADDYVRLVTVRVAVTQLDFIQSIGNAESNTF